MKVYHFCSQRSIKSILRKGLNTGYIPEPTQDGFIMHANWIWLTTDQNPNNQSWATNICLQYSRTAWRLTIEIPDEEASKLYDRAKLSNLLPACDALFEGWKGSENWRVYKGMIPDKWIVKAERM